ncbi:MAG TPA: GTPase, partial [Zeimonas sp.]|nr:GTPase [Zeimonas sp.]
IQIDGVPLNVVDTAGLRDTEDLVERLGIDRTWSEAGRADVVVHLLDCRNVDAAGARAIEEQLERRLERHVSIVRVHNKIDLIGAQARIERAPTGTAAGEGGSSDEAVDTNGAAPVEASVWLSAKTGEGIELLRTLLLELAGWQTGGESTFIARERHLVALRAAREHLQAAAARAEAGDLELDLFAEELRLAQERLNEITGEFGADDLLGVIFSRFCIGK